MLATQIELNQARQARADNGYPPLLVVGRYLRRSRGYAQLNQRGLAAESGMSQSTISRFESGRLPRMPVARFFDACKPLGRLFPLGVCPHDHRCAWQPVRPPPAASEGRAYLETLLIEAGETLDPGPATHHAADVEIGVELDEIGPLAGREAAAILDAEHLEGIARRRGHRGG
jgi:hypothetical protein